MYASRPGQSKSKKNMHHNHNRDGTVWRCRYCKTMDHGRGDCPKGLEDAARYREQLAAGQIPDRCIHCGNPNHKGADCFFKNKASAKKVALKINQKIAEGGVESLPDELGRALINS